MNGDLFDCFAHDVRFNLSPLCRGSKPRTLKSTRERPVIRKLRLFATMRGEHLRAGVIERHEQTPVPLEDFACRVSEGQFMILNAFKCSKRHTAERDDDARID